MRRPRLVIPLSILLFIAGTLVGTYVVRRYLLEQAMISAMNTNDEDMIASLVMGWPCPVNVRDENRFTPLHHVAEAGNIKAVERLLRKCAWVEGDEPDTPGLSWGVVSPLRLAVARGHREVAELLIRHGAFVNAIYLDGTPMCVPLDFAVEAGRADIVRLLLENGAQVETGHGPDDLFPTPLGRALELTHYEVAGLLIDHGARRSRTSGLGLPSLHEAVLAHDRAAVLLFLEHHVDPDTRDGEGDTPLHLAAERGAKDIVEVLLDHGASLTAKDDQGRTALGIAREFEHADVVDLLVKHGATE